MTAIIAHYNKNIKYCGLVWNAQINEDSRFVLLERKGWSSDDKERFLFGGRRDIDDQHSIAYFNSSQEVQEIVDYIIKVDEEKYPNSHIECKFEIVKLKKPTHPNFLSKKLGKNILYGDP